MADNFYYNYKVRSITENKSEFLYFVFLRNIIYSTEEKRDSNIIEINTKKEDEKENDEDEVYTLSQIPTCPDQHAISPAFPVDLFP